MASPLVDFNTLIPSNSQVNLSTLPADSWTVVNNTGGLITDRRRKLICEPNRNKAVLKLLDKYSFGIIPGGTNSITGTGISVYQIQGPSFGVTSAEFRCTEIHGIFFQPNPYIIPGNPYGSIRFTQPVYVNQRPAPVLSHPNLSTWSMENRSFRIQQRKNTTYYRKIIRDCEKSFLEVLNHYIDTGVFRVIQFRDLAPQQI